MNSGVYGLDVNKLFSELTESQAALLQVLIAPILSHDDKTGALALNDAAVRYFAATSEEKKGEIWDSMMTKYGLNSSAPEDI